VVVRTPDINESGVDFAPVAGESAVSFGLSSIRNVGEGAATLIVAEREASGKFASFYDLINRVPEQALNKRTLESLIKAGAFDSMKHPRRGLLLVFESLVDQALVRRRERDQGVMSLFGDSPVEEGGYTEKTEIPVLEFEKKCSAFMSATIRCADLNPSWVGALRVRSLKCLTELKTTSRSVV
jgi:DNA polymerase-3 subunit alpha